ncbi:MAG: DUF4268 domain-containing protein [Bacteroides sp.]|nr:DUF4268 domain-containing protein [Bacteroides sp.]
MKLGKIKRVTDLRSVWHHEAKDFSKWLAQENNLMQLSEAIGVDIVLEELESSVGSFNVDLYAIEEGTDRRIIIENQLEDTNHDHLGKLITYASGKGAEVIVWIVKRARDEHRQAIEWLNQNTGVKIGFFLVEIELWQIDDSAIAPKFNVVERPNDWAKQMKNVDSLSDTKQLQLNFWQQLSETIKSTEMYANEFSPRKAQPQHWYDLSVGSSSYHVGLTVNTQKNRLGAEIYIPDDKEKFAMFKLHSKEIEEIVGSKLEWREATKATRIITLQSYNISDENQWTQAIEWLLHKAILFKQITKQFDK